MKLVKPLTLQWLSQALACVAAYVAILLGVHLYLGSVQQQQQLQALPHHVQQQFMPLLAQSVWDVDTPMVRQLLQGMLDMDGVAQVTLLNPRGDVQIQLGDARWVSHQIELPIATMAAEQHSLGALRLGLSIHKLEQQQWRHLAILLVELAAGLLLLGGLSYRFLQNKLIAPLHAMAAPWQPDPSHSIQNEVELARQACLQQQKQQERQLQQCRQEHDELTQQRDQLASLLSARTSELEQLTRFHQMIAELSSRLNQLNQHRLQGEIAIALARIGNLLEVDRCYLFRVNSELRIHQTQEWCRSGIHSTAHHYENYPLRDSAWFIPQLLKQHLVALSQLDDMPPEGQTERLRFSNHGIQSLAVVTLSHQDQVLGFFGCDSVLHKRDWQDKELTLMRLFSEMLSTVLLQQQCQTELEQARLQLAEAQDKLEGMNNVDGLTGLANQKVLGRRLALAFRQAQAQQRALSILQVDIDLLRDYNDCFGFVEGDHCLLRVANMLQQHFPARHTLLARSGGNRFTVLLPGMDNATCLAMAENLRLAVWQLGIPHPSSPVSPNLTVSIGACSYDPHRHPTMEALQQASEGCLHQAKQHGRNCVAGEASLAAGPDT